MEDGFDVSIKENVLEFPDETFEKLENEIAYLPAEQTKVGVNDKKYAISRNIVAFGESGLRYSFQGLTINCYPWSPLLLEIKKTVETLTGVDFNFVLIDRYEDGNACTGQHKDDDLEKNHPICSLSLGETRTSVFKRPNFKEKRIELKSNTLLVMSSATNSVWSHGIPRQKKKTGVCINLTFQKMEISSDDKKRKFQEDAPFERKSKRIQKDASKVSSFFFL